MKVELSDYRDDWPEMFEAERVFLLDTIGEWLQGSIEHVGSTAVPGMMAKPVIDIMFGVNDLDSSVEAIDVLQHNGYCYAPYKVELMHWFCKPSPEYRTHHLHLVPFGSSLWKERITFRDILRSNPDIAAQYGKLKRSLADELAEDRESYTERKWPFVRKVLDEYATEK